MVRKRANKSQEEWKVYIICKNDGSVDWIYDGKIDKYKLIGHLSMEIEYLKEEMKRGIVNK